MASVEVQNRIKRVEARLPRAVIQQGILIEEASSAVLQIITLRSTDGSLDEVGLGDFMVRNVLGEIRRIPGVGRATLYSTERVAAHLDRSGQAGRLQPHRRRRHQGDQRAERAGRLGQHRRRAEQRRPADFRAGPGQGPARHARGIRRDRAARQRRRLDRAAARRGADRGRRPELSVHHPPATASRPPASRCCSRRPATRSPPPARSKAKMEELSQVLPGQHQIRHPLRHHAGGRGLDREGADDAGRGGGAGVPRDVPVPAEHPLHASFRPSWCRWRCSAPARCCCCSGFSINMLTLFGMVLAIGILVDDAIVVVENVERIMSEEGLSPKEATRKAMSPDHRRHHRHHAGADLGVRADGVLSRARSASSTGSSPSTMVAAIGFSALLALSLTPALCATLLKPVEAGHDHAARGPVRLVQPRHRRGQGRLCAHGRLVARRAPAA